MYGPSKLNKKLVNTSYTACLFHFKIKPVLIENHFTRCVYCTSLDMPCRTVPCVKTNLFHNMNMDDYLIEYFSVHLSACVFKVNGFNVALSLEKL